MPPPLRVCVSVCWQVWRWHVEGCRNDWGQCLPPHTEHVHLMNNYHSLLLAVSLALSLSLSHLCYLPVSLPPPLSPTPLAFPRCPSAIGLELSFCQPSISLSIHRSLPDHGQTLACQFLSVFSSSPALSPTRTCSLALSSFGSGVNNLF